MLLAEIALTSMLTFCGAVMPQSPAIDSGIVIESMVDVESFNRLPRTGKYPGDKPDIGSWEWFPGVTCENPQGNWTGVPLSYNPLNGEPAPPPRLSIVPMLHLLLLED